MLSAYEVTLRQGCKDEAAWRRIHGQIYAEPKEVRGRRRQAAAAGTSTAGRYSVDDAEAMLARFAASEAQYR